MSNEDTQTVETCLEQICQQGCRQVNVIIQQLQQGTYLPEIQHLTPGQNTLLLQELQNIMAVYNQTKSCRLS